MIRQRLGGWGQNVAVWRRDSELGLWRVHYRWTILGFFASAYCGSVEKRVFWGPWAIQRAVQWIRKGDAGDVQ